MRKRVLLTAPFLAATMLSAQPSLADSSPLDLYGLMHVSLDQIDSDIDGKSAAFNTSSNMSRIGVRGKHAFSSNLQAIYQAEGTLFVTDGDGDSGATFSFNRDTFAGLQGDWGQLRVGNINSPTKLLRNRTDFFVTQVGAAGNITGADGQDNWRKNSVFYTTPNYNGVVGKFQYSANTSTGGTQDAQAPAYSASLEYGNDFFWVAVAYDEDKGLDVGPVEEVNVKAYRFASTYKVDALSMSLFYNHARKDKGVDNSDTYGLGARYAINEKIALKSQVHQIRRDRDVRKRATQYAVGADYQYAPDLKFYLNYATVDADGIYRAPTNAGRSAQVKLADAEGDENPYAVSLGMIFKF